MNNNSLQGDLQDAIRNALNCANSFEGDLYALCNLYGVADGAVSGRLIPVAQKHSPTIGTASGALNYLLQNPTVLPSMGLNFVDGTDRLDSRVTFTRASNAWRFNSAGVLTQATTNTPRFDYNPSTLAPRGLLIEEQRTNSIRNNTMVGAVVGVPGTIPTNWNTGNPAGITTSIVSTGTENGISYVDIRYSGTNTSGATGTSSLLFDGNAGKVAAANGQAWTPSAYLKIAAGSLANITGLYMGFYEKDASSIFLRTDASAAFPITSTLTRYTAPLTTQNASCAFVDSPQIYWTTPNGASIDITIRVGLPQFEQGAFATSPIPTSGAAATRAADVASMLGSNFSSWYNQTEGTLFAEGSTFGGTPATRRLLQVDDGSANNRIIVGFNGSTSSRLLAQVSAVSQADVQVVISSAANTNKVAGAYKLNDFNQASNGTAGTTDTSATVPTVNVLRVGIDESTVPTTTLNGYIRRIAYYPRRLANAELQGITA